MGNNDIPIGKEAFETLKEEILNASGVKLNINKGYSDLAGYINDKARENYPPPMNKDGKIIQHKERISADTLRRYWGKKSSNKINNPKEKMRQNPSKLSHIAQALGYKDIDDFCDKHGYVIPDIIEDTPDAIKYAFNTMDYFNFSSLLIGEVIFIGWYGKKYCRLKKIQEKKLKDNEDDFEEDSFEVIESHGMKSEVGRKFATSGFELAPEPDKTIFPEVIVIPRYEYQTELWEYYDSIEKSGKFDIQTCPPELLL